RAAVPAFMKAASLEWEGRGKEKGPVRYRPWRRPTRNGVSRRSILAEQADQAALHLHPVGREDAGFVGRVGGFEGHRVAPAAQALEGGFLVVYQGDDDFAGGSRILLLDEHGIAIEDAGLDHRVTAHFEREVLAGAQHL